MTTLSAAERLTEALDAVAAALAAADTGKLLAAEEALTLAMADLSRVRSLNSEERRTLLPLLTRTRASLERCRVLGRSASDVAHLMLLALGRRSPDYRRSGTDLSDSDLVARGLSLERQM
jgi:hypothetical protein